MQILPKASYLAVLMIECLASRKVCDIVHKWPSARIFIFQRIRNHNRILLPISGLFTQIRKKFLSGIIYRGQESTMTQFK